MGTQPPPLPNFRFISIVAKRLDASRCHLVWDMPQPWGLCVRWGPSPLPKKGAEPPTQFSAHVYCGQTAGWIKMTLGIMEVGLGPFILWPNGWTESKMHLVWRWASGQATLCLMGTQNPSPKGGRAPIFGPFLLWPNGWMHEDATWYGSRPQPRGLCVRWGTLEL